jgi:hypothetical protein
MSVKKFKFVSPGIFIDEIDNSQVPKVSPDVGPVIVGRSERGPAMRPVRVESFSDFVSIFGNPIPGKGTPDTWRDGNKSGATYGAYAAQAYLKNNGPITYVRVLGDESANKTAAAAAGAGWQAGDGSGAAVGRNAGGPNGGAFGLVVFDSGSSAAGDVATLILHSTGAAVAASTLTLIDYVGGSNAYTAQAVEDTADSEYKLAATDDATGYEQQAQSLADCINAVVGGQGATLTATVDGAVVTVVQDVGGAGGNTTTAHATENGFSSASMDFSSGSGGPGGMQNASGTLAAIWYLNSGCVVLTGTNDVGEPGAAFGMNSSGSCGLFQATGDSKQFQVVIQDASQNTVTKQVCNFNDSSANYIRKVFNTDPTLTNSAVTPAAGLTNYWLGETFDRNITERIANNTSDTVLGMIVPIQGDSIASKDGADFRQAFRAAQSGWVFSQDQSTSGSGYTPVDSSRVKKLFKLHSLGVGSGEWDQKNLKVSIQDLTAPTSLDDPYPTFTVVVRKAQDSDNAVRSIERFSDCNLNPNSMNYLGRKVGDKYVAWIDADRAYQEYGQYDNKSQFVRVEMNSDVDDGVADSSYIPFGFFGPPQYNPVTVISGTAAGNESALFVTGGMTVISSSVINGDTFFSASSAATCSIQFPSITMRSSSIDGALSNQTDAYFGLTTTVNSGSTRFDASYQDVVRAKPSDISAQTFDAGASTQNVAFTMDDLFYASSANVMNYVSGSRAAGTSCTSVTSSYTAVLDRGFDRFTMPLFGGLDGFRIDEKDPLRNTGIPGGADDTTSYVFYSAKKAIDTVADPEVVEMNMLTVPGLTYESLTSHMLNVCEDRADSLAILDLLGDYKPASENTDSEAERIGNITTTVTNLKDRGINSSYGCAYYPWVQVRDNINGALLWVPPSVVALGTLGSSAANSEIWFAPAGFNRGGLTEGSAGLPVLNVRQRLTAKNRDTLYEANINPIASFPAEGIVMFGQKTLQVTPSALDRINVRRLLIFLKKEISRISATLLFDQNVQATWDRFLAQVLPFLSSVKTGLGLSDYRVILDQSTTTPDLIDRNIMYAKIFLKPAKAIEFIALDFVITDSGASFED